MNDSLEPILNFYRYHERAPLPPWLAALAAIPGVYTRFIVGPNVGSKAHTDGATGRIVSYAAKYIHNTPEDALNQHISDKGVEPADYDPTGDCVTIWEVSVFPPRENRKVFDCTLVQQIYPQYGA
jgi:hypothetical protein